MTEREIVIEQKPAERKAAERETWVIGSIPQLRHNWSGRCITCANWDPATAKSKHGDCSKLTATSSNGLVNVGDGSAITHIAFGCLLWSEIVPEMTEVVIEHPGRRQPEIVRRELGGPIRARVEHAIAAGLIDDVPAE